MSVSALLSSAQHLPAYSHALRRTLKPHVVARNLRASEYGAVVCVLSGATALHNQHPHLYEQLRAKRA